MINLSDWPSLLSQLSQDHSNSHQWLTQIDGKYVLLGAQALQEQKAKKLKLVEIIQISQTIFNNCSLDEQNQILTGLDHFIVRRQYKYTKLNPFCQLIALLRGYKKEQSRINAHVGALTKVYQKAQNEKWDEEARQEKLKKEEQEKIRQKQLNEERLKQAEEKRIQQEKLQKEKLEQEEKERQLREVYLKTLEENIVNTPFDGFDFDLNTLSSYPAAELNQFLSALEKNSSLYQHLSPEKALSLFLLYEKTAQQYIAENKELKAIQVRLRAAEQLPFSPLFKSIYSHVRQNSHPTFGCKIQPLGAAALKNHVLHTKIHKLKDGPEVLHIEAKINHHARAQLKSLFHFIQHHTASFNQVFPKDIRSTITLPSKSTYWSEEDLYDMVEFANIGKIYVGAQ